MQSAGTDQTYYVWLPDGTLLSSISAANNSRRFYHFDESGSVVLLTDTTGAVTDTYAISIYGDTVSHTGATVNTFTFQGKYGVMAEGSTSLYYMRARYYDSAPARFLSRDPLTSTDPRAINPYQFVYGNPVEGADPTGKEVPEYDPVNPPIYDPFLRLNWTRIGLAEIWADHKKTIQRILDDPGLADCGGESGSSGVCVSPEGGYLAGKGESAYDHLNPHFYDPLDSGSEGLDIKPGEREKAIQKILDEPDGITSKSSDPITTIDLSGLAGVVTPLPGYEPADTHAASTFHPVCLDGVALPETGSRETRQRGERETLRKALCTGTDYLHLCIEYSSWFPGFDSYCPRCTRSAREQCGR